MFSWFVLCLHRRQFSKRSECKHTEPAGEGQTDGVEEQMVERETRGRCVSGKCSDDDSSRPGNLLLDDKSVIVINI